MSKKLAQTKEENVSTNNIVDLDLSPTRRQRIRFDKDDNRVVEIDTSDMAILSRLSDAYPKLTNLQNKAVDYSKDNHEGDDDTDLTTELISIGEKLKEIDTEMRELIDFIFDAPVSAAAAPTGSMYGLYNGSFRYEHIITVVMGQYERRLQSEYAKIQRQMDKHVAKYTKG